MKLLLDQGLPRSAAALLCEVGIDTMHVAQMSLSAADDTDILQRAREDERML
jgi:predicted nuclease of predicted toxin-antitoxin system